MTTRHNYLDRILWVSNHEIHNDYFNWTTRIAESWESRIVICQIEDVERALQRAWELELFPVIVLPDGSNKSWKRWALSIYPSSILFMYDDSEEIEDLLYAPPIEFIELLEAHIQGNPHDPLKIAYPEIGKAFTNAYLDWQARLDPDDEDNQILLSEPNAIKHLFSFEIAANRTKASVIEMLKDTVNDGIVKAKRRVISLIGGEAITNHSYLVPFEQTLGSMQNSYEDQYKNIKIEIGPIENNFPKWALACNIFVRNDLGSKNDGKYKAYILPPPYDEEDSPDKESLLITIRDDNGHEAKVELTVQTSNRYFHMQDVLSNNLTEIYIDILDKQP